MSSGSFDLVGGCIDTLASRKPSLTSFQVRTGDWMQACFGPTISADRAERCFRFIEESLELAQAAGASRSDVLKLVDYVYGRQTGHIDQEVGGVLLTLAALCAAFDLSLSQCGENELARVWQMKDKIRAKHDTKPIRSPLPGETVVDEEMKKFSNGSAIGKDSGHVCGKPGFIDSGRAVCPACKEEDAKSLGDHFTESLAEVEAKRLSEAIVWQDEREFWVISGHGAFSQDELNDNDAAEIRKGIANSLAPKIVEWIEHGRQLERDRAAIKAQRQPSEDLDAGQLLTQLAGCLTAAEGGTHPSVVAKQGDYGWSLAYQAVLDLCRAYDALVTTKPAEDAKPDPAPATFDQVAADPHDADMVKSEIAHLEQQLQYGADRRAGKSTAPAQPEQDEAAALAAKVLHFEGGTWCLGSRNVRAVIEEWWGDKGDNPKAEAADIARRGIAEELRPLLARIRREARQEFESSLLDMFSVKGSIDTAEVCSRIRGTRNRLAGNR